MLDITHTFGDRPRTKQPFGACEVIFCELKPGLGTLQFGLGAVELGLIRSRIDDEQQIAGLDLSPVFEFDLIEIATRPRPDIHCLDCFQPARVLIPLDDLPLDRLAHSDRGRWRRWGWVRSGLAAASQKDTDQPEPKAVGLATLDKIPYFDCDRPFAHIRLPPCGVHPCK